MRWYLVLLLVPLISVGCTSDEDTPSNDSATAGTDSYLTGTGSEDSAYENEDIATFFARFKSTVRANNAEAVANLAVFPFERGGIDRESFLTEYYPSLLGEGDFRDRLLAGSPAALQEEAEGGYSFAAHVSGCGEAEEEMECESAAIFYFGQDAEGRWHLVDMLLAG